MNWEFVPDVSPREDGPAADHARSLQGGIDVTTSLGKLANDYLSGRLRRREITRDSAKVPRYALRSLCKSFGNRPVNQLGEAAIERWLETIADKSPATRRNELGAVRRFCGWLVKNRHLRRNPCEDIPKIRQPRTVVHTVQRDEIEALWQACTGPRDRALVALMFVLGLRCTDCSKLNVEDFDRRAKVLIVTGKGGHERTLPVVETTARVLEDWISQDPRSTGAMFPSWSGRLKAATISGRMSTLMLNAGVKQRAYDGKSAHALRRTAATETLEYSGNLRATQNLLGHADLSSMRHYIARASVGEIRDAVDSRFHHHDAA